MSTTDFQIIREKQIKSSRFVFNQLREKELNELFEVDEKQNLVRYVSPIRVGQECLVCHGAKESLEQDPSGTLKNELQWLESWGNPSSFCCDCGSSTYLGSFPRNNPQTPLGESNRALFWAGDSIYGLSLDLETD